MSSQSETQGYSQFHNRPVQRIVTNIYGCFFHGDLVTSHVINLYLTIVLKYLESTLHTVLFAMSDKLFRFSGTTFVKNGMNNISEPVC